MLKRLTGHKTDAMLARYTHLFVDDVLDALDATEPPRSALLPPDHSGRRAGEVRAQAQARRLNTHAEDRASAGDLSTPERQQDRPADVSPDGLDNRGDERVVTVDLRNRRRAA